MDTIKLIPNKKNIIVRICREDDKIPATMLADVRFELRTLCDVPILVFRLQAEDVVVAAINFKRLPGWPDVEILTIQLQLFDLSGDAVSEEKQIVLDVNDMETLSMSRLEQRKMKPRQIDAIVDFIYSDYVEFAGLTEVM